jgi:hypothetical protein
MKLTVHIGSAKTGSTSVQAFLHQNKDVLAGKGVCRPKCFRSRNHTAAALACLPYGPSKELAARFDVQNINDFRALQIKTLRRFDREIDKLPVNAHVVITSEHLQSRLKLPEQVKKFKANFAAKFERVEIILYLRPQADMLVSLYSTLLKNGRSSTLPETVAALLEKKSLPYFDFQDLIVRWSAVFGAEAMNVRAYAALDMARGGVVTDFCDVLGIPRDDPAYIWPELANTSINKLAQATLVGLNKTGQLSQKARRAMVLHMEKHSPGKGATLDIETAAKFQRKFDAGNKWVVDNYFPGHPEYLQPRILKA